MRDLFKLIWTRHGRIIAVLILIALMYGFAINPYLLPNTYDNVVYYMGAKSLAESGAYVFNGYYVADWGPGFPLLLSIPMVLGMDSVVVAKLVVLASVLASVIFIYRCFQREKRTFPVVNCLIVGFLSTAFLMGTRLMSEWLFILVSMVFFELLYVLNIKRKYSIAIVVGLLLGFSSLVRWIGVLLGVALVAQAVIQAKGTQVHRLRVILPECVSAAIGALIFISWKAKLAMQLDAGTAVARYHQNGWEFLNYFNPLAVVNSIGDLFFKSDTLFRVLHVPGPVSLIFCTLVSVVILSGVYVRIRSRKIYPSDFYVLVSVILLMFVEWKMARYLLPLAPFLVSYFVEGLSASGKKLETLLSRRMQWMFSSIIVLWLIMSFTSNLYLLVLGNANKSHAGLSPLRSPTAESFYGGVWRELYAASNIIANDSMVNRVAYVGPYAKYGLAFTGKPVVDLGELQAGDAIIIEKLDALPVDEFLNIDVIEKNRWNSIRLFYVLDSDVDGGHIDFRE